MRNNDIDSPLLLYTSSYPPVGGAFEPIGMLARWANDSDDSKTQFSLWNYSGQLESVKRIKVVLELDRLDLSL